MNKALAICIIFVFLLSACAPAEPLPLVSGTTSTTVTLEFQNNSTRDLKLYWQDWDRKENYYADLPAGTALSQPSFPSHVWLLRDDSNVVGLYIGTEDSEQQIAISDAGIDVFKAAGLSAMPFLRSLDGGRQVALNFVNNSGVPLDVYWVNVLGQEEKYGTAENGGEYAVSTYFAHAWRLRDRDGNVILNYMATESDSQAVTISETWLAEALQK
jgi:hypothetical protein